MSVSEETNEIENAKQDKPKEKSSFPRTMKKPLHLKTTTQVRERFCITHTFIMHARHCFRIKWLTP